MTAEKQALRGFAKQRLDAGAARRADLLLALADGKEHTTDELRRRFGVGPDTIWRDMRKLRTDGFVRFIRRGPWRAWQAVTAALALSLLLLGCSSRRSCVSDAHALAAALCEPGESWEHCFARMQAADGTPEGSAHAVPRR